MSAALCVLGVTGKMGKSVLTAALNDPNFHIVSGTARKGSCFVGQDLGSLIDHPPLGAQIFDTAEKAMQSCTIAIDFSLPAALSQNIHAAQHHLCPLVIGTTPLSPSDRALIETAAQIIPIVYSANFSIGISLCLDAIAAFTAQLPDCHITIEETHHIHKKDAPSGTALAFAKAAQREVPIHSVRTGQTVGEHLITFTCKEEQIELKHIAHSRDAFARGALAAAKKLLNKPPGFYALSDL